MTHIDAMKSSNVVLGAAALILAPPFLTAQNWAQNANGQQQVTPCGAVFNFPSNNNWSQQQVLGQCGDPPQSYVAQPSNWTSAAYPNSTGAQVVLNGPTAVNCDVSVLVDTVTIGPNGGLNLSLQGRIQGQSLILQRDLTITKNSTQGGFAGDIFLTNTLRKTAGTGAAVFEPTASGGIPLNLTGVLVDVQAGRIVFPGNGNILGANFQIVPGSLVDITGGGSNGGWGGNFTGSGGGTMLFANGVIVTSAYDANSQPVAPVFNFPGDMFQWTGGQFGTGGSGNFALTNNGVINATGPGSKLFIRVPLTNHGTFALSGTGSVGLDQFSDLHNESDGVVEARTDYLIAHSQLTGGSFPEIYNAGTWRKSGGTGAFLLDLNVGFNLTGGTVQVEAGSIALSRGNNRGGTYIAAAGSFIDLTGGSNAAAFTGTYTGSGAGHLRLSTGSLLVGILGDQGALPGPVFHFPDGFFEWRGGRIATGRSDSFSNTGFLQIIDQPKSLVTTLLNSGTIRLSGGNLNIDSSMRLDNLAGGTIDVQSDFFVGQSTERGGSLGRFVNRGLLVKSGGAGAFAVDVNRGFDNFGGTIRVESGFVNLSNGRTIGANYVVSAGTYVDLSAGGGTIELAGVLTGSGAGTVRLAGGTVYTGNFDDDFVTQPGPTLNFPAGLFQWTGGLFFGGRSPTLANAGIMNLSGGAKSMYSLAFTNSGTMRITGGDLGTDRCTLTNAASGLIDVQSDLTISANGAVTNAGTWRKSGGSGTATMDFQVGFTNSGRVEVQSGRLAFGQFSQSGGQVVLANNASISVSAGQSFQISGGAFNGTGTIAGSVNNTGTLALGSTDGTASAVSLGGNYSQTAAATLQLYVSGTSAGHIGMLQVAGTANLAGTVDVRLANGFAFRVGDVFQLVSATAVTGAFSTVTLPAGVNGTLSASGGTVTLTITGAPAATSLVNISTRARVETGDGALIGGFVIAGPNSKRVIIRALGPSLAAFGVSGALANPTLRLVNPTNQQEIAGNDDWRSSQQAEIQASGFAPTNDFESAIVATLAPGSYTGVVSGVGGATGVGLIEVYDLDTGSRATARPVNVSTRARVLTGDNILIGGFVVGGVRERRVLIRALGPSLTAFGVAGALADPTLEIKDATGVTLGTNDNWKSTQQSAIQASGFAPPNDLDSAILLTLPPGACTALVRGVGSATGVGLVEVYDLE